MFNRSHHWIVGTVLLCVAWAAPCVASQVSAGDEPPAAQTDAAALKKQADAIFAKSLKRYREMDSYRDSSVYSMRMSYLDESGEDMGMNQEDTVQLVAARPNRFRIKSDHFSAASDGKRLRISVGMAQRYLEIDAPSGFNIPENFAGGMGEGAGATPVLMAMEVSKKDVWQLFPSLQKVTAIEDVMLNDTACTRIDLTAILAMIPSDEPVMISVWIDKQTSLLKRLTIDYTEAYRKMQEEMKEFAPESDPYADLKFERAVVSVTVESVELNPTVSDDDLRLDLPEGAVKVDSIMALVDSGSQRTLVGEPAPDFASKDFDEKPIALSDFKGKVVVLDFWATWCGPCVQALPHIQEVAEKMKDKPVVVLGINRDPSGSEKRVRRFLEKKKISFRQLKDFSGDIAADYHVSGIPCTVLIDKNGVVQEVTVGFSEGGEDLLAKNIDKLIAGEQLFDSEELARMKKNIEEGGSALEQLPEVNPERFVQGDRLSGANQLLASADLDHDGTDDYVFMNNMGGRTVRVLYGGAEELKTVELEGLQGRETPQFMEIVEVDGKPFLVAVLSSYRIAGRSNKSRVGMFRPDGTNVWTLDLEVPDGAMSSATLHVGDTDGDGVPDIAVMLQASTMHRSGPSSYSQDQQASYLVLVDRQGKLMLRKSISEYGDLLGIIPANPPELLVSDMYGVRRCRIAKPAETRQAKADDAAE